MRTALRALTTNKLDHRSAVSRAVEAFKAELTRDLGGNPSAAQQAIIEVVARTWIMLWSLDDWLQRQPTLIDAEKRAVVPVLLQRQELANGLVKHLQVLGIERKAAPVESLHDYMARKYGKTDGAADEGTDEGEGDTAETPE
jgi:hypothetical protein